MQEAFAAAAKAPPQAFDVMAKNADAFAALASHAGFSAMLSSAAFSNALAKQTE